MFDIAAIKRKQGKRKTPDPPEEDAYSPFDRPLPYYSIVPEQRWQDQGYQSLSRQDRGDLCQLIDFLWQGCGSITRSDIPQISAYTLIPEQDLTSLIRRLLLREWLIDMNGRLTQPQLRSQYVSTRCANDNRKRLNDEK